MSNYKLELKIVKDSKGKKIELDNMSIGATKSLMVLLENLAKIIQSTPNSDNVRIQITKGSASIAAEGAKNQIEVIENDFFEVAEHKSTNKELVDSWKNIQSVILANGLEYEVNFFKNGIKNSVLDKIKVNKYFQIKKSKRKTSETCLTFITGKLIAVGGKNPNIHILGNNEEKFTIKCIEEEAIKVNAFLYKNIYISAWRKKITDQDNEYSYCDFYKDNLMYDNLKLFIEQNSKLDKTEALMNIHYKLKSYLDNKDFGNARKFIRLFKHKSMDVDSLKTILVITKFFKDHDRLKDLRHEVKELLEIKLGDKLI